MPTSFFRFDFRSTCVGLLTSLAIASGCPSSEPQPEVWEESLRVDASIGAFLSVWGPAPDDIYAVGGNPEKGVLYHYDGTSWQPQEVPGAPPLLNWIDGSSTDTWIVGNEGVAMVQSGGSWERRDAPTSEPLWGVWASSSSDVWAVGGDPLTEDTGVIVHYDGAAWAEVELPELDRSSRALFKVWGTGPNNIYAVGDNGVILHSDGGPWTQQASGTTKDLISLWGTGPDEIVAVGGRGNATIVRFDGTAWTAEVGTESGLNGVWVDSEGKAHVCGQLGRVGVVDRDALTYTSETITNLVLHGAFGFDDGPHVVVGGSLDRNPPWEGVILLRGGS